MFLKLPEAKGGFEAQAFHGSPFYIDKTLEQFHLPPGVLIQLAPEVRFVTETRFFVAYGCITAYGPYRINGVIWESEGWAEQRDGLHDAEVQRMCSFVEEMLADPQVDVAPGCTIDVGILEDGTLAVVEANAAWSSGPYDCDPAGVRAAVKASYDFGGDYLEWRWKYPVIHEQVRPLKICVAIMGYYD